jgi:exosortase C (VPDSG-CTERM-specific)
LPLQGRPSARKWSKPLVRCAIALVLLTLAFGKPLYDLAVFSFGSELYSHVLLIPAMVGYLIVLRRKEFATADTGHRTEFFGIAALAAMFAVGGLGLYAAFAWQHRQLSQNDYLSLTIFSYVCFALTIAMLTLGTGSLRPIAYPLAMLFFMVPFPEAFTSGIETFLQHASAEAANALFVVSGQSFARHDLIFQLPGIAPIAVAPECSGIRSSLVLFISSLLAVFLFLRKPWFRALLAFSVLPLGILRNGFRIFTISMLCAHVDPAIIHSPIHHRGGPIFFLLSLIPFFILLCYLRHIESRRNKS